MPFIVEQSDFGVYASAGGPAIVELVINTKQWAQETLASGAVKGIDLVRPKLGSLC